MRLTTHSDYALRLLIYVAVRDGAVATVPEVAKAYNISANHLTKIVHKLGQGGFIRTSRGRSGGIVLAQAPEEIGLGRLVRFTEPGLETVPSGDLGGALGRAKRAFLGVLDEYTLADLVGSAGTLPELLSPAGADGVFPAPVLALI